MLTSFEDFPEMKYLLHTILLKVHVRPHRLVEQVSKYVLVRVHVSVSSRLRGLTRARGVLMVKILNINILSILVYNLFLDRQRNILYTPHYFHIPLYCLSS